MMSSKTIKYSILLAIFVATSAFAQDTAVEKLNKGKRYFWEARFDQAVASLTEVTQMQNISSKLRFDAYLHLGFVLTRQDAPNSEIDAAFEQAVRSNPEIQLDETVIPPDLSERFNSVRDQMVGCVYVTADHPDVNIIAVKGDTILFSDTSPTKICNLAGQTYQLFLTERGYKEEFKLVTFTAGVTDTLFVTLTPKVLVEVGGGSGTWKWVAGGGILAGAVAVLYTTVLSKGDEGGGSTALPVPPVRPVP